jgi:6-phosphofructo-2-kinase
MTSILADGGSPIKLDRKMSNSPLILRSIEEQNAHNEFPQAAPGTSAAVGHTIGNSFPLSIFPIATDKFCICFCGLPGRGKTHISRRLARYLSFFHAVPVELFNVSEYRRNNCAAFKEAAWFHPGNRVASIERDNLNIMAISDMVNFLNKNSNGVGIFDATNATHQQRARIVAAVRPTGAKMMFIEVSNRRIWIMKLQSWITDLELKITQPALKLSMLEPAIL